jgi:hypothetical protein
MKKYLCLAFIFVFISISHAQVWYFGVIADTQSYRKEQIGVSVEHLTQISKRLLEHEIELVLVVGDLIGGDSAGTYHLIKKQYMTWKSVMKPLYDAGIDIYPIRGNHDKSAKAFREFFPALPKNGPDGFWESDKQKGLTYWFEKNNAVFIGLDMYTARKPDIDFEWLENVLKPNQGKHVFIYGHEPIFGRIHEGIYDDRFYRVHKRRKFASLLYRYGIPLFFVGHDHIHCRTAITDEKGNLLTQQIMCAPAGKKTYPEERWRKPLEQETILNYHIGKIGYYIVRIDNTSATVNFFSKDFNQSSEWELMDSYSYDLPINE